MIQKSHHRSYHKLKTISSAFILLIKRRFQNFYNLIKQILYFFIYYNTTFSIDIKFPNKQVPRNMKSILLFIFSCITVCINCLSQTQAEIDAIDKRYLNSIELQPKCINISFNYPTGAASQTNAILTRFYFLEYGLEWLGLKKEPSLHTIQLSKHMLVVIYYQVCLIYGKPTSKTFQERLTNDSI